MTQFDELDRFLQLDILSFMTTHRDYAPLDQFPSEGDSGVPNTPPGQTESMPALGRSAESAESITAFLDEEHERGPSRDEPHPDPPDSSRMFQQGPPAPARMPGRGLAVVIFGTAVLGACLVAGIVWVTLGPIPTAPTPASAEANSASQSPDRSLQPR